MGQGRGQREKEGKGSVREESEGHILCLIGPRIEMELNLISPSHPPRKVKRRNNKERV